jgi:hypothetical protein
LANTTWNPSDKFGSITLSGGNLIATANASSTGSVRAIDRQVTGKFYWECTFNTVGSITEGAGFLSGVAAINTGVTVVANGSVAIMQSGRVYVDSVIQSLPNFGTITNGTIVCIAYDCDQRLIWFRLGAAGNWNNSAGANPATGSGGVSTTLGKGIPLYPHVTVALINSQFTANFGDTAFTGAVPSGYTSGFTAGASVPTNAIASQALAEHWMTTNPDARITQVVAEHWASTTSTGLQAVVTFVALEHWTSVAVVVPAAGGPMVTMIH